MQDSVRKTILIVDDDKWVLNILQKYLEPLNYIVLTAENGLFALKLLEAQKPDIIISDVVMPGMDGIEFCRAVRSNPALSSIPFIFLSARTNVEDRIGGIELGADDYICKPFSPREVAARVEASLRRITRNEDKTPIPTSDPQKLIREPSIPVEPGSFEDGKNLFNKGLFYEAYHVFSKLFESAPTDKNFKRWKDLSEGNLIMKVTKVFGSESSIPYRTSLNPNDIVGLAKNADEYFLWTRIDGRTSIHQLSVLMPSQSKVETYKVLLHFFDHGVIQIKERL